MSLQYWSHKWNTAEPVDPDCSQYMASQWLYSLPLLSLDCNLMNCPCFCPANQLCGVWSCGGRRQNFFTPRPVSCHTHPPLSQQLSRTIFLFSIMTKTNTQPSLHPSLPFSLLKKQQHTNHSKIKYKKCLINTEVVVFVGCFTLECITTFLISQSHTNIQCHNLLSRIFSNKQQCVKCSREQLIQMKRPLQVPPLAGWSQSLSWSQHVGQKSPGLRRTPQTCPGLFGVVFGACGQHSPGSNSQIPLRLGQFGGAFRLPGRVEKVYRPLSSAGFQHAAMALCRGMEAGGAPSSLLQFT